MTLDEFAREAIDRLARLEEKVDGLREVDIRVESRLSSAEKTAQVHDRRLGRIETAVWTMGLLLTAFGGLAGVAKVASAIAG